MEKVPEAPADGTSVSADDALAPEANDAIDVGEKAADHPLGTEAARMNDEAGQLAPFLFVTVTVRFNDVLDEITTTGAAVVHSVLPPPPRVTRMTAPSRLLSSV